MGGNLDEAGVRGLGLGGGTGLQRFVKMVDGFAGGVLHLQKAIKRHPPTIIGVHLWVYQKNIEQTDVKNRQKKNISRFLYLQTFGCIPDSVEGPESCQRLGVGVLEGRGAGWSHPAGQKG